MEAEPNDVRRREINEDFNHAYRITQIQQRHEQDVLRRTQQERIRETGIDPDAAAVAAHQRRADERRERNRMFLNQLEEREQNFREERNQINQVVHRAIGLVNAPQRGELARFAGDNQNIHTVRAVNMTKEMVAILLTIPVPAEYKWNSLECSKTPGDIVMTCRLTPKAAWQMISKYCQEESIYELGKGIYGKVLDGVWQYVLSSPDKADLCRVLKQEMEDNIGMCAQGNLSRLCNILAGYMEGIGSQESIADILGRLMPKLMEIEDLSARFNEALKVLKENNVPVSQWKSWVEPLMFDQDVEMTVGFIRNAQDEVVGFVAVNV
jgi:hypothetical protein